MSTILIVDDETLARDALAKLLDHEGFTTLRARNGREAWAMMYNECPDLVVLDLMMPEMDGVTFLSMVRRDSLKRNLPVIVLTGAADRDHLIGKAWDLGVNDLVPKADFTVADLVARVRYHLSGAAPAAAPRWRGQSRFAAAAAG
jgi:two-component system phosphate regulon response regulator PhoB